MNIYRYLHSIKFSFVLKELSIFHAYYVCIKNGIYYALVEMHGFDAAYWSLLESIGDDDIAWYG